jgi:hypothetical protein
VPGHHLGDENVEGTPLGPVNVLVPLPLFRRTPMPVPPGSVAVPMPLLGPVVTLGPFGVNTVWPPARPAGAPPRVGAIVPFIGWASREPADKPRIAATISVFFISFFLSKLAWRNSFSGRCRN